MTTQEIESAAIDDTDHTIDSIQSSAWDTCSRVFPDNMSCEAFPDGIPEELFDGKVSHHTPYPGDHGIQFESIEKPKKNQDESNTI